MLTDNESVLSCPPTDQHGIPSDFFDNMMWKRRECFQSSGVTFWILLLLLVGFTLGGRSRGKATAELFFINRGLHVSCVFVFVFHLKLYTYMYVIFLFQICNKQKLKFDTKFDDVS